MKMIAAADRNWGIGKDGKLLASLPADMKNFRKLTENKTVVMGRKTFDSIGQKPLPGRMNIVITGKKMIPGKNLAFVSDMNELFDAVNCYDPDDIYVIGGGEIYRALIDYCDTAVITKIDHVFDADTFFPDLDADKNWVMVKKSEKITDNGYEIYFTEYMRV